MFFFNFSPLEQFDSVTYILKVIYFEGVQLYTFYLFETEYFLNEILHQSFNSYTGLSLYGKYSIYFLILIFILILSLSVFRIINYIEDFSYFFFGVFFSLFLPNIFDFFYTITNFEEKIISIRSLEVLPQIHFSLMFDENFISFLLAFFFIGGSEDEEDEDFLLEEEESDFIDDVIAPLFLANLGKDIDGNGELLVKVSSIFSFVLINNLMGMLPYSDTGTSSLMLTF
jgi:hypothetical protein